MHDLRSDTVTRPTQAMRDAMACAEVGDDVFGDDPTVNRLESVAARIFAKEAALFVPSGTMANQICIGALTSAGDEIIAEEQAHVLQHEVGSASRLWGCQIRTVTGERGVLDPGEVEKVIREPGDIHYPRTSLLSLENTHNFAGGTVLPLASIDALVALARARGLSLHMDGARVFNAAVASGVDVARITRDMDLVSVCLSKGLGAPVGSLVLGDAARVDHCRRLRKALGGGMRQVGILAAAGILALTEGPGLLGADHNRARALAEALVALPGVALDLESVQTNIVILATRTDAFGLETALADAGVLCCAIDRNRLRFVFHRDVGDEALAAAVEACRRLFS